jgi:hypothetical protein
MHVPARPLPTLDAVAVRLLVTLTLTLATLGSSSSTALGLVPRVAICGRVTSFVDAPTPGDDIVRLGTQEPRRLMLGSQIPQIGEEICIWGTDVENVSPPSPDPAPKGIVAYQIAAASSIGCADAVTATSASFVMPGESASALPNHATLVLPQSAPAGNACVRIAVDAQGNPVALRVPAVASASPQPATPTPRASAASLPNTSADSSGPLAFAFLALGTILAEALFVRRPSRRAIPS